MSHHRTSYYRALLCGAAAITLAGAAGNAVAAQGNGAAQADQPATINIAPQPLAAALGDFASQTRAAVLVTPALTQGRVTQGVSGAANAEAALNSLLAGTGLVFRRDGDTFLIVQPGEGGSSPQGESAEGTGAGMVDELIVTAQKKGENIQDVPIAISAFSMKTLDAQKIEGGFDLLKAVPNVTFSKTNFSGYNFSIRGIGTQAISATTDPGVAVSFNNTTLIVNRLFEQEYLDVERVEVLRGPQGTLYGRNATSGVINVISAKPVMGDFSGEMKLEAGNFNAQRIRGHVNVPVGDTVAIRAAFASTKRDGYGYNQYSEVTPEFRDPVSADVDNRDLWTGRISVGWEPNDRFRANFIYERFEEDDRRVRTSKQLCTRDTGTELPLRSGGVTDATQYFYSALSQGCKAGSLYADEAFGTPNGASLPFMSALYWGPFYADSSLGGFAGANNEHGLGGNPYQGRAGQTAAPACDFLGLPAGCVPGGRPAIVAQAPLLPAPCTEALGRPTDPASRGLLPVDVCNPDVFRGQMQSRDLRTISSQLEPAYRASADLFELSFDLEWTESLTLSSQTVYAEDSYYATQDYNRFTAFPIWNDSRAACGLIAGSANSATIDCSNDPVTGIGTYHGGFYAGLTPGRPGSPLGSPGILCDPQLGCSDTLLMQDLSRAESKQFNQEIRLVSSFDAPVNFSLGVNYTDFETINDYFVFANALTHLLNFFPFQTPASQCYKTSTPEARASRQYDGEFCRYVDPNPLESIDGDGHNYFRSGNPYRLNSAAIFGELYWRATDTLKITAGLRYTWDRKVFTPLPSQLLLADYRDVTILPDGAGPELCVERRTTCVLAGTAPDGRGYLAEPDVVQEWRVPTGRLGFDWKPQPMFDWLDETMIYGFLSHGYKGGGANPPSIAHPAGRMAVEASGGFAAPPTFAPEYVNAIEFGTKNTMFGGSTTLNLGAFYYDYTDYQVSKILDRSAYNENFDAEVWGLELEAMFAPTRNLRFNAAVGWLQTRIADGEQSIDLMDRTDGGNRHFAADPDALGVTNSTTEFPDGFDEWVILQPWIVSPSNCIVPKALLEANQLDTGGNFLNAYCPTGNVAGTSTATLGTRYLDANGNLSTDQRLYDPAKDAPNGGAGFFKDLSGNELPSAPHWTVSLGGQYTMALPGGWDATLRGDFYWQSQSFARVYNMGNYDKLRAWTNANLSLWFDNADWGVKAEVYVKNVFDETPITGAFLNSDDSGLTTNVFTLDPRLVGVSVTKSF